MRTFGLYDATRGVTTAVAAGTAGLLLWVATRVGAQSEARFWAAMGIVAGAGLLVSLAREVGSWTKGVRLRLSVGTLVLGFLPVLVCVAWILLASQPGTGFAEGRIDGWTSSIGLTGIVHDLALWHGVLAFGLGIVLGLSLDGVPALGPADRAFGQRGPLRAAASPAAADEPVTAERDAIPAGAERMRTPVE